ncbi:MAG TPA: hypothetical protein VHW67_09965 [Solirubrobacteraceae bacterium]|jgi:hypothetical protein|nr:hypothetical protein [Solirubrobacteraceae bacterium]
MGAILEVFTEGFSFIGGLFGEAVEAVGGYIIYGGVEVLNGLFDVFQAVLDAAGGILPELPETTSPPEFVTAINWFFPLAALLAVAGGLVACYVTWLAIKWVYKKYGAL